jgi:hypothetical protein
MGRQINFYLHPNDYQDFENTLKAFGNTVFLPYYHYNSKVRTIETTIPINLKNEGSRVYLIQQQDLSQIELEHIEKFDYWLVADRDLPVLHYDRCDFDKGKMVRGRLYFQPSFIRDMQSVNKSSEFVIWADSVLRKVRRSLIRYKFEMDGWGFSEYVGKNAKDWLDKTKLENGVDDSSLVRP